MNKDKYGIDYLFDADHSRHYDSREGWTLGMVMATVEREEFAEEEKQSGIWGALREQHYGKFESS